MKTRELLFSITKKDLEIDYYKASGKGGQNRNKRDTAVRIRHKDSGAVGDCSNFRTQGQNKKEAFKRLVNNPKFQQWIKIEASVVSYGKQRLERDINKWVEEQLKPENLKIEYL